MTSQPRFLSSHYNFIQSGGNSSLSWELMSFLPLNYDCTNSYSANKVYYQFKRKTCVRNSMQILHRIRADFFANLYQSCLLDFVLYGHYGETHLRHNFTLGSWDHRGLFLPSFRESCKFALILSNWTFPTTSTFIAISWKFQIWQENHEIITRSCIA